MSNKKITEKEQNSERSKSKAPLVKRKREAVVNADDSTVATDSDSKRIIVVTKAKKKIVLKRRNSSQSTDSSDSKEKNIQSPGSHRQSRPFKVDELPEVKLVSRSEDTKEEVTREIKNKEIISKNKKEIENKKENDSDSIQTVKKITFCSAFFVSEKQQDKFISV